MDIKLEVDILEWMDLTSTTTSGTAIGEEDLKKMGWVNPIKYEEPCAIIEFCKRNPDVTSVCMTCNCPRCTVTCSTW